MCTLPHRGSISFLDPAELIETMLRNISRAFKVTLEVMKDLAN